MPDRWDDTGLVDKETTRQTESENGRFNLASASLVLLTLFVFLLVGGVIVEREYRHSGQLSESARHAVRLTAEEITDRLANLRGRVAMFVHYERDNLRALYREPGNQRRHDALLQRARSFLPGLHAFTLLSPEAESVVDDFDGIIGEICREDTQAFLRDGRERLRIHPNPVRYHFDLMVPLEIGEGLPALLLAAIDPGLLASLLAENAPMHHALILVDSSRDRLVEISAQGSRDRLPSSQWHLPVEDPYRLAETPVMGTAWTLVDRIDPGYLNAQRRAFWFHALLLMGGLMILSGAFLVLHYRDLARWREATRRLSEANVGLLSMNTQLETLAATDALTGLANRRQFDRGLREALTQCLQEKRPFALLLCDLDHFKQINDRRGHQEGDLCLQEIAALIASQRLREEDLVARYGGDEIALMLPGTDCRGAVQVAERLRKAVESLELKAGEEETITLSIGVVCHDPERDGAIDPEALMARADDALYQAKAGGKNRVMVVTDSSAVAASLSSG